MANWVNIKNIKTGDVIKTSYKVEGSESDEIFNKNYTVESVSIEDNCIITTEGNKIYGSYAANGWFNVVK